MTWIYPTRGRPEACAALLASMVEHGMTAPGVLLLSESDPTLPTYLEIDLPTGWSRACINAGPIDTAAKLRRAFDALPDEAWYGWVADDNKIITDGFEQRLVAAAGNWGMASANDKWQARKDVSQSRCHGATVFGGDLIRALGWIVPDGFEHCYIDDVWEMVGRELGIWRVLMDVHTPHRWDGDHAVTRSGMTTLQSGKAVFDRWVAERAEEDITRARLAMWAAQGLSLDIARQRSVMLAFPVYERPHHQHEAAAMQTVGLLSQLGIRHGFAHVHAQPVHTARNLLAKAFLDSRFTDLMFIDADMSWQPWDVVRLLAQKHPFIGGVGRKRNNLPNTDGRAYCFSPIVDGDNNAAHDEAGCIEVNHVGTGFLLVNRLCFEAIEQHGNPDKVTDADGIAYTRFFKWDFKDGVETSEDFQFCHAYREIGGKVMVDPSIELSHFGTSEHKARLVSVFA